MSQSEIITGNVIWSEKKEIVFAFLLTILNLSLNGPGPGFLTTHMKMQNPIPYWLNLLAVYQNSVYGSLNKNRKTDLKKKNRTEVKRL